MNLFELLEPLGLTLAIEYPIVQFLWLFVKEKQGSKLVFWKNRIIIIPAIIVNALTNPLVNIIASFLFYKSGLSIDAAWFVISILELIIWAVEAILYKFLLKTRWENAICLALTANYVSYLSSFLIY